MIANPLLLKAAPYIVVAGLAGGAGWWSAWYAQGLRLTAAKQDLVTFQQGMLSAVQAAREHGDTITKQVGEDYAKNLDALHGYYRSNPVVRLLPRTSGNGLRPIPATPTCPGQGPSDNVPSSEDWRSAVAALESCGETTLMFVQCRDWARKQREESLKNANP